MTFRVIIQKKEVMFKIRLPLVVDDLGGERVFLRELKNKKNGDGRLITKCGNDFERGPLAIQEVCGRH